VKLLLDENFNNDVLRGLRREMPDLDIVRAQDIPEIFGHDDPTLLDWAALNGRVVLTHDVNTLRDFAYERVRNGLPMLGAIVVPLDAPTGKIIEDILIVIIASHPNELENQVIHLPFK
jgi:predicted nuclease of predicted toxin-antitoxin system